MVYCDFGNNSVYWDEKGFENFVSLFNTSSLAAKSFSIVYLPCHVSTYFSETWLHEKSHSWDYRLVAKYTSKLFVNKINFELQSGHTKHKHLTRFFMLVHFVSDYEMRALCIMYTTGICKSAINTLTRMKSLHFVIAQKMCKKNIKCCCFGCSHCNQESLFVVAKIWDLCWVILVKISYAFCW